MAVPSSPSIWPAIWRALLFAAIGAALMTIVAEVIDWYPLRFYLVEFGALAGFAYSLLKHWQQRFAALEARVSGLSAPPPAAEPEIKQPASTPSAPEEARIAKQFESLGVPAATPAAPRIPSAFD